MVSHNGVASWQSNDCFFNSVWSGYNVRMTDLSPFTTTGACGMRNANGIPYLVNISDANGCSLTIHDTIRACGFANPTPTVVGACQNSSNGQINDTLTFHDDSLNYNFLGGYYTIYLYSVGNPIAIDTIISSYSPVYSFQNLGHGDYRLDYYISSSMGSSGSEKLRTVYLTVPDLGVSCGTISGDVFVDVNKNCVKDFAEPPEAGAFVFINPGGVIINTDKNGHYAIDLNLGPYTVNHNPLYNGLLGKFCPVQPAAVTVTNGNNTILNLADTSPGLDFESYVFISTLRPSQQGLVGTAIYNISAIPSAPDSVVIHYDPTLIMSATFPTADSTAPGYAKWYPSAINTLDHRCFEILVEVPNNVNLIGTIVSANGNVYAGSDINSSNNWDTTMQVITGAYDPNHKTVYPSGFGDKNYIPVSTPHFDFQIEFQNTGNDTAFNVVIVDTIDAKFDLNTFIPFTSSHEFEWKINSDREITFTFDNIYLPDSGRNMEGSKGFINYRISLDSTVNLGDVITNTAYIYFDNNPAIITNTTSHQLYDCDSIINSFSDSLFSCEYDDFQVIAEKSIPAVLSWKIDNTLISSNDTLKLFSQLPIGDHLIEVNASTPYCSQKKNIIWRVFPDPVALINVNGNNISCNPSGTNYQWFFNNDTIPNATDTVCLMTLNGYYFVVISNDYGCQDTSSAFLLDVVGIEKSELNHQLYCWPNPASDFLNIKFSGTLLPDYQIRIFDLSGRIIAPVNYSLSNSTNILTLDIKNLVTGLYHLELFDSKNRFKLNWVKN